MQELDDGTQIGILLGKLIPAANTLVYSLHIGRDGRCETVISQRSKYATVFDEVCHLGRCLGDRVYAIWRNKSELPWYYVQLKERWGGAVLHPFEIPITAKIGGWTEVMPE